jgi:hypothetical protein
MLLLQGFVNLSKSKIISLILLLPYFGGNFFTMIVGVKTKNQVWSEVS